LASCPRCGLRQRACEQRTVAASETPDAADISMRLTSDAVASFEHLVRVVWVWIEPQDGEVQALLVPFVGTNRFAAAAWAGQRGLGKSLVTGLTTRIPRSGWIQLHTLARVGVSHSRTPDGSQYRGIARCSSGNYCKGRLQISARHARPPTKFYSVRSVRLFPCGMAEKSAGFKAYFWAPESEELVDCCVCDIVTVRTGSLTTAWLCPPACQLTLRRGPLYSLEINGSSQTPLRVEIRPSAEGCAQ
jgi:hypothetical protein